MNMRGQLGVRYKHDTDENALAAQKERIATWNIAHKIKRLSMRARVYAVIVKAGKPITTRQIADKMRAPLNVVSVNASKMCAYGFLRVVATRQSHVGGCEYLYVPTEKEFS